MQEFICPNGRMSINGACPIFEGGDGQIRDYQTPKTFDQKYESIEDIPITQGTTPKTDLFTGVPETDTSLKSPEIIDTKSLVDQYKSKEISSSRIDKIIDSVNTTLSPMVDKVTQPVKDTVSEVSKSFFKFDFEKETPSAKKSAGNIISENIGAYNDFVENKLGIPSNVQNLARVGSAAYGALTGGSLVSVVAPFAIPFVAGAALNNKAQKEQEAAINRESVIDLQGRINAGQFGSNTPTPQDKAKTNYGGSTQSRDSIGSRGSNMSGYGGGADMGGGSPGSSGPGGSDEMGSF